MGKPFLGNERIGMKHKMSCGIEAKIIAYHNAHDIDVEFDGGYFVYGKSYKDFAKGLIKCPMQIEICGEYAIIRSVGTTKRPVEFMIDTKDIHHVQSKPWRLNSSGYVYYSKNGEKQITLHRLVMNAPEDKQIDHKDGNRLNCRKSNLRVCTQDENSRNRKKSKVCKSGYKGVTKDGNKWRATIGINKKYIYLGGYETPEAAAHAYNQSALKLHGEFARLNDI